MGLDSLSEILWGSGIWVELKGFGLFRGGMWLV